MVPRKGWFKARMRYVPLIINMYLVAVIREVKARVIERRATVYGLIF